MSGLVLAAVQRRDIAIALAIALALLLLLAAVRAFTAWRRRRSGPARRIAEPGLTTLTASTITDLLGPFLDWLHRSTPTDPFAAQVVVVPNAGVAEYLEDAIRSDPRFGVCANVDFMFPGRFRQQSGEPATWQIGRAHV